MQNHFTNPKSALISAGLSVALALGGSAGEKTIALKAAPAAVQKAVADQLKGGTLKSLSVETEEGRTEYEAELTVDGREKTVAFDPAGTVLETEAVVDLKSLSEAVRAGLAHEAGKGTITRVEEVTSGAVIQYEALVKEAGKKNREVVVGSDGKPVSAKK